MSDSIDVNAITDHTLQQMMYLDRDGDKKYAEIILILQKISSGCLFLQRIDHRSPCSMIFLDYIYRTNVLQSHSWLFMHAALRT